MPMTAAKGHISSSQELYFPHLGFIRSSTTPDRSRVPMSKALVKIRMVPITAGATIKTFVIKYE